jgi:hypothetical protein
MIATIRYYGNDDIRRGLVLVDSLQKQEASRLMAAQDHLERE